MNIRRKLIILFHFVRFLLLIISLLAIWIIYVWIFKPSIVRDLDANLVSNYMEGYELLLHKADSLITKGEIENAIINLEILLEEIKDIKKHDRLDPIKRVTLEKLAQMYIQKGDLNQALILLETWVAFDENDLFAQVELAQLLNKIPGRKLDGLKIIEEYYEKVPTFTPIVDTYINLLLDKGEKTKALLATYRLSKAVENLVDKLNWQIFWDDGSGFNIKQSATIQPKWDSNGLINVSYLLPKGLIKRFRIDIPSYMRLNLVNSSIYFQEGSKEVSILLSEVLLRHHHVNLTLEGNIVTNGKDPYFFFNIPEGMGMNAQVKIVFRAKVLIPPHERLNALLFDPKTRNQITNALAAIDENEAGNYVANRAYIKSPNTLSEIDDYLNLFLDNGENTNAALASYRRSMMIKNRLKNMKWQVFWDNGSGYRENQSKRLKALWQDDGEYLALSLIIPKGKLKQLRIDSPGGFNMRIEDIKVSFDDGLNQLSLLIKDIDIRYNDITPAGNGSLITHGIDPFFFFDVPNSIGVNGEVKIVFHAKVSIGIPDRLGALLSDTSVRKQIVDDFTRSGKHKAANYIFNLIL